MCVQCIEIGPPPDTILTMPPPPLPSFLVPNHPLIPFAQNDSKLCYAAYVCESLPGPRIQSGIEFIELPGHSLNDAWFYVIIASIVGVILLITVVIFTFIKCRENKRRKHLPPKSMCHEPHVSMDKSQSYMSGNMLYPCPSNEQNLQQDINKEGRLLWATLTPHGTRHFVTARGVERYPNYDDHYEIIDYHNRPVVRTREGTPRKVPIKAFENNGYSDFDYEDMHTTNAEMYHDENDSGYQEPHEVISTLHRAHNSRLMVSSPTRIEHPNMAPLNAHNVQVHPHRSGSLTTNRKATLSRRTTETLNYYGQGSNM
ncbi:uncharacterized protein LOC116349315 [Contarinia nasturtii]|uniref:uncharacterized protein LOC116349315 n=1 Tax=Contarinia nasturtii TaxID=265458 RepID=UPI0012D3DE37|nr:uncharacterized protein LOC116349315 [Contarinia nasturtii]XP_031636556.1 uncharacterized protein LOC116349315 [Contarinia nasturtii]